MNIRGNTITYETVIFEEFICWHFNFKTRNLDFLYKDEIAYTHLHRLGEGGYGFVDYINERSYGNVACKREFKTTSKTKRLKLEFEHLIKIHRYHANKKVHISKVYALYNLNDEVMMLQKCFSIDLESYVSKLNRYMTLDEIACVGVQMIDIFQDIHEAGFIHRDIKPANIMMHVEWQSKDTLKSICKIFLVDFGLSGLFRDGNGVVVPYRQCKGRRYGSSKFCSRFANDTETQSPRDDLESLGYVLIYLLNLRLPWDNRTNYRSIKENIKTEKLCEGAGKPLLPYMKAVLSQRYDCEPDYKGLRSLLSNVVGTESRLSWNSIMWDFENI